MGISDLELARRVDYHAFSLRRVLNGVAKRSDLVWHVSEELGLDWAMVHNFDLKPDEFQLAVRNGGSER